MPTLEEDDDGVYEERYTFEEAVAKRDSLIATLEKNGTLSDDDATFLDLLKQWITHFTEHHTDKA